MKIISRHLLPTLFIVAAFTLAARAERPYEAWRQRFDFAATVSQGGTAIAVDARGNVAITGFSHDVGDGDKRYYTAKYAGSTGELLWSALFDAGFGANLATSVAMDSAGNVIVTGGAPDSSDTLENFQTIKYASADGAVLWARAFDGPNSAADQGRKVVVDSLDNVIVAGTSIGQNEDIQLVRYSPAGTVNGQFRFTGAQTRVDFPTDLVMDGSNFAIVTGNTTNPNGDADIYLAKVNLATGTAVWTRIIAGPNGLDDEGKGVAVDGSNSVIVTGILAAANNTHRFYTRKYDSAGNSVWEKFFDGPVDDFLGPVDVAVDAAGNAFVTGTSTVDNFTTTIYTAKYAAADAALLWEMRSPAPNGNDAAIGIAVDGAGNAIITGASDRKDSNDPDYYTAKYGAADGALLWEQRFNGNFSGGGDDTPAGVVVDNVGNVAITGVSTRPHPNQSTGLSGIVTIKYQRLLALTGDDVPGAGVTGSGVPNKAKFKSVSAPALADTGALAATVNIAAGPRRLSGILFDGNGVSVLPAVQGAAAPGVAGGRFKSFLDPVIAPNGAIAFSAKLSGVPDSSASGVWTTAFNGTLQLALQQGAQVPGLPAGVLLKSVTSISLRNGELLALLKVKGSAAGVTEDNDRVLLRHTAGGGTPLLRTDQALTVGGQPASNIVALSVLSPAAGSPGHGRSHADGRIVAKAKLADGRVVLLNVASNGTVTPLLFTDQSAAAVTAGALWETFGLPAVGTAGAHFAALGTLQVDVGGVTAKTDTAPVYSPNGVAFAPIAKEGAAAPGADGALFDRFFDPLVSANGEVALLATLKGTGVTTKNRTGFWWGAPAAIQLVARLGSRASDGDGILGRPVFSSLLSTALPAGPDAGPIFLAKLRGNGVTTKNNVGLWAVDTTGLVRRLLRTGDTLGTRKIASLSLLKAVRGDFGATRSFNAAGAIALRVTFTNGTQAILPIGIP